MPSARPHVLLAILTVVEGCTSSYDDIAVGGPAATGGAGQGAASASSAEAATASTTSGAASSTTAASVGGSTVASTGMGGSSTGGAGGAAAKCGDGVTQAGEQCDDANTDAGDGCDACACQLYDPASGHCWFLLEGGAWNWDESLKACPPGWEIASLETIQEHDLVVPLLSAFATGVWIGGSDKTTEGFFEWESGQPWTFVDGTPPWTPGEPNDYQNEDCVELWYNSGVGTFNDNACGDKNSAVLCELVP